MYGTSGSSVGLFYLNWIVIAIVFSLIFWGTKLLLAGIDKEHHPHKLKGKN